MPMLVLVCFPARSILVGVGHGKRKIHKRACVISHFVTVILLGEHFEGIAARHECMGDRYVCRTACAVSRDTPIVEDVIAAVTKQDGNIFVNAGPCAGISDRKTLACFDGCGLCGGFKAAAAVIFQRQLPFRFGCADRRQVAIHLCIRFAADRGRREENIVRIQVKSGTNERRPVDFLAVPAVIVDVAARGVDVRGVRHIFVPTA